MLLETLGADGSTSNALFLLAEMCSQGNEKSKPVVMEFATDLVNSFAMSTRLTVFPFQLAADFRLLIRS